MNISQASKEWGVSRTTIYAKIKDWELTKTPQGEIDPSEMIRVFGHAKQKWTPSKIQQSTPKNSQEYTLLEQALHFEQERTKDLQNRLTEATEHIHAQEKQIFELLATIKDLSQSVKLLEPPKPRKKFLGIF